MADPVSMFGPDGQVHDVQPSDVQAALGSGGEYAHAMLAPDGTQRWVKHSDLGAALRSGGLPIGAAPAGRPNATDPVLVSMMRGDDQTHQQQVLEGQLRDTYSSYGEGIKEGVKNVPFIMLGGIAGMAGKMLPASMGAGAQLAARAGLQGTAMAIASHVTGGTDKQALTAGATGAIAEPIASAIEKVAPLAVQKILNIRGNQLRTGAEPGEAVLSQTSAITAKGVASQTQAQASVLTRQLESMAAASKTPATVQPAIDVVDAAVAKAQARNSGPVLQKLQALRDQLTTDVTSGNPLPITTSATDLLNRKRGVGDLINSWTREEQKGIQSVLPQVYRAMDAELDRTVPGSAPINHAIQSLIVAKKGATRTAEGSKTLSNIVAQGLTGTAGAGIGTAYGYAHGGNSAAARDAVIGGSLAGVANTPTAGLLTMRGLLAGSSPLARAMLARQISERSPEK